MDIVMLLAAFPTFRGLVRQQWHMIGQKTYFTVHDCEQAKLAVIILSVWQGLQAGHARLRKKATGKSEALDLHRSIPTLLQVPRRWAGAVWFARSNSERHPDGTPNPVL